MDHYRIRIRNGDAEIEIDSSDRDYVESKLTELTAWLGAHRSEPVGTQSAPPRIADRAAPAAKGVSLVEHVRKIGPKSGTQFVMAVGHYLEQFGGMATGFKTRDVAEAFQTVKYKHSNTAEAVRQAKAQGFLMDGKSPNTTVLTQSAEAWVSGQLAGGDAS
jgi:hypothetical protein